MVLAITAQNRTDAQYQRGKQPQAAYAPVKSAENAAKEMTHAGFLPQDNNAKTHVRTRTYAPLVAQLAATAQNVPQTRVLRRVDSADGAASYAATSSVMLGKNKALPSWEA